MYSWIEIVKHDKADDCWIVIGGLVYDVSEFVDKHPGYYLCYN
jgi:cytochrome b involved in lipid metabolism